MVFLVPVRRGDHWRVQLAWTNGKTAISVNSLRCQKLRGGLRNTFGSQSRSLNDPLNNSPTF